jgi:hypothetical protein
VNVLLHPAYFPNITTFGLLARYQCIWETEDNYQKQTYRNRCYICNDRGRQMLNIPIAHVGGATGRQKYREVRLDNSYQWQRQHWRSLQTAYRTSPFFEFYEDELAPLFHDRFKFLLDFNMATIARICECLQMEMTTRKTLSYEAHPVGAFDARFLVDAKADPLPFTIEYHQVFVDRHGFIPNLSILDLLFNTGTTAHSELMKLDIDLLNG